MPRGTNGEIEEKLQINGRERNEQEDCRWSAGFMKQSPEISKGYSNGRLANEAAGGSRDGSGDVEGCCGTNGGCLHYSYALAIPPAPPFQVETPGTGASIAAGTTIAAVAAVAAGAAAAAAPGHANTNFRTPRRRTKSTYGIVELGENIDTNVKDQENTWSTREYTRVDDPMGIRVDKPKPI
ncbi:hypothetical protein V1478_006396 [Vespula squamosa]|uniref:Uncharacterized protein n=1 Tax=Vespula squamosa TaxID=30214 RepID=A0ABD2B7Q8_VESSQ